MKTIRSSLRPLPTAVAAACTALLVTLLPLRADLGESLGAFPERIPAGDPGLTALDGKEGPKGVAAADFDGDFKPDLAVSNLDSSITVLLNAGGGRFAPPRHLRTEARELRSIIAADLNNDGKPDLAVASPQDGQIVFFLNAGGGNFGPRRTLFGWFGVRGLASGDFDGDGLADLAAAGPGVGVRHFRGTGGGNFTILGDLPRLSPVHQDLSNTRPVYSMRTIRSRDGLRDELLVTHADSSSLWILSTQKPDRRNEAPVLDRGPQWNPASASAVVLNEVQVQNATTLRDADGTTQPWVELLNRSPVAVNLAGWKLKLTNVEWAFPSVTIEPGRFLMVFLSGKDRNSGPELHASFLLKQSTDALYLLQPDGAFAASVDLEKHTTTDVSRGLAPDSGALKWFDIPSPGAENNAGLGSLDDVAAQNPATLIITPRQPATGQSTTISVTVPEKPTDSATIRDVWFAVTSGLREAHYVMHRQAAGVYEVVLEPGAFGGAMPHRVLARFRDDDTTNDYTVEVHRGLDDEADVPRFPILPGCLLPVASVPASKVKSFEVGVLTVAAATPGALPDLVFADDTGSVLLVHRAADDARRFRPVPSQVLPVAGLPRDVKLGDMDHDGWVDALVVLQATGATGQSGAAVISRNSGGTLRSQDASRDTGSSPREATIADFTGDDRLDAAVINRYSQDVSILVFSTAASGPVTSDQIYPVDADVAALSVRDFDANGRDDVLQLHRASSEISLRLSAADGRLAAPRYFPVGAAGASALEVTDVNNDGLTDVVTANLGLGHDGSISVLLGTAGGNFQAPRVFHAGASLFALTVADFDKDGHADVAAGLWDCSVKFLRGDGTGTFAVTPELPVPFVNEARVMVTADFDQDGDLDIAGAGIEGDMVTLENRTATAQSWRKQPYAVPNVNVYGAYRISLANLNNDSDPDLIIGTGRGVLRFLGMPGMLFSALPLDDAGVSYAVSDVLTVDWNLDGTLDLVTSCRAAACLDILSQLPDGGFQRRLQVAVPSSLFLATGDLDDDGLPDLVGTGDVLWTALSSRAPQQVPASSVAEPGRPQATGLFINEILPRNTDVPVAADGGKKPDYVEIFNGTAAAASLSEWKMRVQGTQDGLPFDRTWTLPAVSAAAGGRTVLLFSEVLGQNYAGFSLPAEGGTVMLLRPDGAEADRVVYPPAPENVAWSRYQDGHPSFRADPVPSPGLSNVDNGGVAPEVKLTPPSPRSFRAGEPIKFTARGSDDHGIISMSLFWNRMDAPYPEPQRLNLYDDGRHGDGPAVDGVFAGTMPALPAGAEVQFYMEATDIGGEVLSLPEVAELSPPGEPPVAWSFTIADPPTLAITDVCTDNADRLRDETGGHPDYIKVRNTGTAPAPMSGILLAKSPLAEGSAVFAFPSSLTLQPGAEVTVFADGNPAEGPMHAPFSLDAGGDDLALLGVRPSGARLWIHSLSVPALAEDESFGYLPGTALRTATAQGVDLGSLNYWPGTAWDDEGVAFAIVRFRAWPGATWIVEGDAAGAPVAWAIVETIPGDDALHTVIRPLSAITALRVSLPSLPAPLITAAIPGVTEAGLYCYSPGAVAAALFYSVNPDLSGSRSITLTPGGTTFSFNPLSLLPGTVYYFRVWTSNGVSEAWSQGIGNFRTLNAGTPIATSLQASSISTTRATIAVGISPATPADSTITVLAGPADHYGNPAAWPTRLSFTGAAASWSVNLTGLLPDTLYYVRAAVTTAAGTAYVSPRLLTLRTWSTKTLLTNHLVISEIMYNPPDATAAENAAGFERDDFEFLELQNTSTSESLDLSGLWFKGIDFDFPATGAPVLSPGGFAIIAAHPLAFGMRYGAGIPLAGWTLHPFRNSKLSNGGEELGIHMANGDAVFGRWYNDYPPDTDGSGNALVLNSSGGYISGNFPGGTPGWLSGQQTFGQWTAARFTAAQYSVSGADADPDHDGLTNFAEYTSGTDPLRADYAGLLAITDAGLVADRRTMRFSFPVNRAGRNMFRLQYNTLPWASGWWNLETYYSTTTTAPPYTGLSGSVVSSVVMSDPRRAMVTISVPLDVLGPLQARRFFRLTMAPN